MVRVVWVVPLRGVGPIRLAGVQHVLSRHPENVERYANDKTYGCIDATKAIDFLDNEPYKKCLCKTDLLCPCPVNAERDTLIQRLVELRPCDGSYGQQFTSPLTRGVAHIFRLASNSSYYLAAEGVALTLSIHPTFLHEDHPSAEKQFQLIEHRTPTYSIADCHLRECLRVMIVVLLGVYIVISAKAAPRWMREVWFAFGRVWALCSRKVDAKSQELFAQRRITRAKHVTAYIAHVMGLWLAGYFWSLFVAYDYAWFPWRRFAYHDGLTTNTLNCRQALYDSELVPAVFLSWMCLLLQFKRMRSTLFLDACTILSSLMWSFKYYALTQGNGGTSLEHYLYNESWMLISRMCLNAIVGKASMAIPCNIVVTCVDVYCFTHLTATHVQMNDYARKGFYLTRQVVLCLMTSALQLGIEVTVGLEVSSAVRLSETALYERLATRLTTGVFDTIVHLDHKFCLLKPAPTLATMLLRSQIGLFRTDFRTLVSPEDVLQFTNYMQSITPERDDETCPPIHVSLLDASGSKCKVQVFVSACPADSDASELVYILGISEDHFEHASTFAVAPGLNDANSASNANICSIPEGSVVESEGESEPCSNSSASSEEFSQRIASTFELDVWSASGKVVRHESALKTFLRTDPICHPFYNWFHDPSSVRAWIQMQALSLQSGIALTPHEGLSPPLVLVRRGTRFGARIKIGAAIDTDNMNEMNEEAESYLCHVSLTISEFSKSKKRCDARKKRRNDNDSQDASPLLKSAEQISDSPTLSSQEGVQVKGSIDLAVSSNDLDMAIQSMADVAESIYRPLLGGAWREWMFWWNDCQASIADVPFMFAKPKSRYACQINMQDSNRYSVATRISLVAKDECFRTSWDLRSKSRDEEVSRMLPSADGLKGRLELSASCSRLESAFVAIGAAAAKFYMPFVGDSWEQWLQWWNLCRSSLTVVPSSATEGAFSLAVKRKRSGVYTLSARIFLDEDAWCFAMLKVRRTEVAAVPAGRTGQSSISL
eukprot:TRINITY_DN73407_c0_g1_i1.p1 TRINITY_DN73407_c0_g1~~TRINITY_DN73407_c0_g1_i1.p1  ORF type:complete len:1096 (+),score=65.88 TRINITY_DN73407_c0_g1_i1:287-3289(+)